jgi:hypothetical protein
VYHEASQRYQSWHRDGLFAALPLSSVLSLYAELFKVRKQYTATGGLASSELSWSKGACECLARQHWPFV